MIEAANKLGYLLLSLSTGGKLLIAPSDIESYSDYFETIDKKTKKFVSLSTPLNIRGWLVTETIQQIVLQLCAIGTENEQEPV